MTILLLHGPLAGLSDQHIKDTAAAIANKRREGWKDAQITTWLLNEENRKQSSQACPWGCNDELVAAAFEYITSGLLPQDAPQEPSWWRRLQPSERLKIIGGASLLVATVAGLGTWAVIAHRRRRAPSAAVGRPFFHEPATVSDRNLLRFAEKMRDIPRVAVRDEDGLVAAAVNTRHARAIFKKIAPTASQDGVNAALTALQDRLDDRMALDRIGR